MLESSLARIETWESNSALLVTVPPPEEFELSSELLNEVLDDALDDAEDKSITGRDLTPFLLSHMAQHSEGRTWTNIALLENNARVATQISVALKTS